MKVTLLTVTHNQQDKLEKLYKSIIPQKECLKEWIVYDDASDDAKWLKEFHPEFPFKVIYGKKRSKPLVVANMNECIKASEGLFMLVFADTYLREDALKNLSETYIPNSFGSAYKVNVSKSGKFLSNHYLFDTEDIVNVMSWVRPWENFSGNGMIATREIMERIGFIDEGYTGYGIDDYDTAMRAMMNGALLHLYGNVRIFHIDHLIKDSSNENMDRYKAKMKGEGYRL